MIDENEIGRALAERSRKLLATAMTQDGDEKLESLRLAMNASCAGWVLCQATPEQVLEIFDKYRPPQNRN